MQARSVQAGLRADSTVWPKEPQCHCWGPGTVSFLSRDGTAIFVSDEFTAAVTVTGEGFCLKRQKKSTKTQLRTAGTLAASLQNKLQTFRCDSSAIFITLSLKGYSKGSLVMGSGLFPLFFMAIPNLTWERPHCRPPLDQERATGSLISCKPRQCWGFPQAQPSLCSHGHSQEATRPPKCDACSSGLAGMSASAHKHHQHRQKLSR